MYRHEIVNVLRYHGHSWPKVVFVNNVGCIEISGIGFVVVALIHLHVLCSLTASGENIHNVVVGSFCKVHHWWWWNGHVYERNKASLGLVRALKWSVRSEEKVNEQRLLHIYIYKCMCVSVAPSTTTNRAHIFPAHYFPLHVSVRESVFNVGKPKALTCSIRRTKYIDDSFLGCSFAQVVDKHRANSGSPSHPAQDKGKQRDRKLQQWQQLKQQRMQVILVWRR